MENDELISKADKLISENELLLKVIEKGKEMKVPVLSKKQTVLMLEQDFMVYMLLFRSSLSVNQKKILSKLEHITDLLAKAKGIEFHEAIHECISKL